MSWVAAAGASIGLTAAAIKGVRGYNQKIEARRLEKNTVRPTMTRTAGSIEQEDMARQAAGSTRMPGASYAENQIGAQTARANNAIQQTGGSTGEIISGLSNIDQNARNNTNDLAYQGAQLNQQNKEMFSNVLNNVSQDQKDIFDYNQNQPYQTKTLRAQQLRGSSDRNISGALDTLQDTANNFGVANGARKAQGGGKNSTSYQNPPPSYQSPFSSYSQV